MEPAPRPRAECPRHPPASGPAGPALRRLEAGKLAWRRRLGDAGSTWRRRRCGRGRLARGGGRRLAESRWLQRGLLAGLLQRDPSFSFLHNHPLRGPLFPSRPLEDLDLVRVSERAVPCVGRKFAFPEFWLPLRPALLCWGSESSAARRWSLLPGQSRCAHGLGRPSQATF